MTLTARSAAKTPEDLRQELRIWAQQQATQAFNERRALTKKGLRYRHLTTRFTTFCEVADLLEGLEFHG
jgi:hypothetical protein